MIEIYLAQLVERFGNPRIRHRLDQIAADGSQKLPIRVVPVLRAAREARTMPLGATRVLAGWLRHLRGYGVPVVEAGAAALVEQASGPLAGAVPRVLAVVAPDLAGDADVIAAVREQYDEVARR
jgi:fructuronate reductase